MTPVYIFNGRKQTLVDTIGILSALRMRGLHEKRHLLAKLRIAVARIVDCVSYLVEDFYVGMLAEPDDLVGYTPQLETT